ncbi:F0F1 ATP synthase subunit B family protein [Oceanibacterium hippocampi]|uniref:ATP synthase subunit b n=1 Tax=Oceanibacterium hippocampi TaxID=745714 RepID=A0A1Y5S8H4_9PROT|nr:hypothetical protein [Oceanibacterium hippocampi]SLN33847.1 ATP synthase subunit b precursor [Oceanibacterium hippocampi]
MLHDPAFWVAISFLLFIAVVLYYKVPGMIAGQLDSRAARIKTELETAQKLREDAQALYAEYQRKQRDALATAEEIVAKAKADAKRHRQESEAAITASLARRTEQAEQRIRQAEENAVAEIRAAAVEIAVAAAGRIIGEELKGKKGSEMVDKAIGDIGSQLH